MVNLFFDYTRLTKTDKGFEIYVPGDDTRDEDWDAALNEFLSMAGFELMDEAIELTDGKLYDYWAKLVIGQD